MTHVIRQMSRIGTAAAIVGLAAAPPTFAQEPDHAHMNMGTAGWQYTQDGTLFAEYDRQGGPRGGEQFVVPNWWMGTARRKTSRGDVELTAMLSLDPATVGRSGYRELFQSGESLDGRPIVDRQHPHDFFMQIAATWRIPMTDRTGLTLTGAPVGEPTLGPVAFMHRASATDNPTAPLGHHTFDSTHISFGVVTAAVDHGPWTVEGSLFNGREPDDRRWDLDFGRLDSFAGRLWFKPTSAWDFQVSSGRLTQPEKLEPGSIVRSTASASWTRSTADTLSAVTIALGRNDTDHGARSGVIVESTQRRALNTVYARFEALQVETALLETTELALGPNADLRDRVYALTIGGVRDVVRAAGLDGGIGADVTFYRTPDALTAAYGPHPTSVHIFFRLRPRGGRMLNMRMGRTMGH